MTDRIRSGITFLLACLTFGPLAFSQERNESEVLESPVGASYHVPYLLTETNHFIVRARINGRGPFNLVVDTGAPMLFLSLEAAEKAGLKRDPNRFFVQLENVEFEGGATLKNVQARAENIYQVTGMNALGLPGVRLDGMVGFNVLARFEIEIDPTDDRMKWSRIEYNPPDMREPPGGRGNAPAEVRAMGALGGIAQLAAVFIGRQPDATRLPRGLLGIELKEDSANETVEINAILPDSAAETAGLQVGDRLVRIFGKRIRSIEDARREVAEVEPGQTVRIQVESRASAGEDDDSTELRIVRIVAGAGL